MPARFDVTAALPAVQNIVVAYFGGWKDPPDAPWYLPSPWGYPPGIVMGDYPERHPLYGTVDEDNQDVINHHLELAESAGITVFAVNWYRDDYLSYAATRMAAAPADLAPSVKWCVQWSNHYDDDQTFAFPKSYLFEGVRRAALRMNGSRYWLKDSKPVFILFSDEHLDNVIATALGQPLTYAPSLAERNALVADIRNIVGNVLDGDTSGGISGSTVSASANPGPYLVLMTADATWTTAIGIDATTRYNFNVGTIGGVSRYAHTYEELHYVGQTTNRQMLLNATAAGKPTWPVLASGWSRLPWGGTESDPLADNCLPETHEWRRHLVSGRILASHPRADSTVFIYAWNEFGEGGWIQPTPAIGTTRLDAISVLTETNVVDALP